MIKEVNMPFTLNVKIPIKDTTIDDILVTALEGGINYWCKYARIVEEEWPKGCEHLSDTLTKGSSIALETFEDEQHILTLQKFQKGIEKYVEHTGHFHDLEGSDAEEADHMIQFSLFGDIIYG